MESSTSTSIRQRLLNLARQRGEDYNQVLIRYAGLRLLARLATSDHASSFLLKGATMFLVWHGSMHRPTSDIDLLGFFEADEQTLIDIVCSVCQIQIPSDGITYDPDSVKVDQIREDNTYGGLRCTLSAYLGTAKLRVQLDVGFGDAVTPQPSQVAVPTMLDSEESLVLNAYTPETVIAEKFHAISILGMANSRMKDYLDLQVLLSSSLVDPKILAAALENTFKRRGTPLPAALPVGLTEDFWSDEIAKRRWEAFATKNRLTKTTLETICRHVGSELLPFIHSAQAG